MAITTTCPGCAAIFRLSVDLAGKSVRCQKCDRLFVVPIATVGQGMPMSSTEPEVREEMTQEGGLPPRQETESESDIVDVIPEPEPLVESNRDAQPSIASAPVANSEPAKPVQAPPPNRWWTAAAVGSFLFAFIAIGAFAAIWVSVHLAPPPRLVLVPPLKEAPAAGMALRDRKDFFLDPAIPFQNGKFGGRPQRTWLFFDKDESVHKTDRLVWPNPRRDFGPFANHGPSRVYHLRLERDRRYNFFIRARGFNPQLKIHLTDDPVGVGEFSAENRLFVSFTPQVQADYTIWITSLPHQEGDFDLHVAQEQQIVPKVADLRFQPRVHFDETLRVQDPREKRHPKNGPYHEYHVHLTAGTDYLFKINENRNESPYQPILQIFNNGVWEEFFADRFTRRLTHPFRPAETREYRVRVTGKDFGEGAYTLSVERKSDVKPATESKALKRYLVRLDDEGRYQETHTMSVADPLERSAPGRGPYKEYVVSLTKGERYRIEMASKRFPPMVSLLDEQGNQIAHQKGAGMAAIDFTPPKTGTYRIRAIATHPFDRGVYTIKIIETP